MRHDKRKNQTLKLRSRKSLTIPVNGLVTWSKNCFRKKPIIWGVPAKHKATGQERIDVNTRIALSGMAIMKKEREKAFYD